MDHQARYDKWAPTYNRDVAERQYAGLHLITEFMMSLSEENQSNFNPIRADMKILDVGCGTGMVGEVLAQKGFSYIDGVDLSIHMIHEAHKSGVYQTLIGWADIRKPPPFTLLDQYDLAIASGVFTLDMVRAESLQYLIRVTKRGGLVVLGTRTEWCDTYDFEGYYKKMIDDGYITLIGKRLNAPYLVGEFNAHYWAFAVENNDLGEWPSQSAMA